MPVNQLTNFSGEENESQTIGHFELICQYDSSQSGNLVNGTLVAIESLSSSTSPILIKKATTSPDFYMLGVVVNAPTGGVAPGGAVEVLTHGVVQCLFDANNTTAGHLALQSSTTAGCLTDSSTATLGKTMGTILQSVTISSGTALVWVLVGKM